MAGTYGQAGATYGQAGGTYGGIALGGATGGNLTKPRLHLGNAPGPRRQHGNGALHYTLTITGYGQPADTHQLVLPTLQRVAAVQDQRQLMATAHLSARAAIAHHEHLHITIPITRIGTASEDADDVLVLLSLGR